MQFTAKFAALALAIAPMASAHLIMQGAFPGTGGNNQGPLSDSGSDYPCLATTFTGTAQSIAKGSQSSVQLLGSAVHGGGSCQISITYDAQPTKSSKFTVIKSFQGKCPIDAAGNLPADPQNKLPGLPYTIPEDAPSGKAILAWTWFNKIGNREMYMRCAPITITGSAGDKSKFGARPEILKANIGNGCATKEGVEVSFPNPGDVVVGQGTGKPEGNCGPSGSTGGSSSAPATTPAKPAAKPSGGNTPATPAAPATQAPAKPAKPAGGSGSSGACTGSIVCTSATTWAQCSNGVTIPMGAVAAGTKCVNGQITKRSISRRKL